MGACTSLFAPPAPRSKVYLLDAYVPDPVIACFRQLETSGAALSSVVFANMREGDISFVQDLEADRKVDFSSVNNLSVLCFLKSYLDSIPEPLIPYQASWMWLRLFDSFQLVSARAAGDAPADSFDRLLLLRAQILNLPPPNQTILRRLLQLLARLVSKAPIETDSIALNVGAMQAEVTTRGDESADTDNDEIEPSPSAARAPNNKSVSTAAVSIDAITPQRLALEFAPLLFRLNRRPASTTATDKSTDQPSSSPTLPSSSLDLHAARDTDAVIVVEVVAFLIQNFSELFLLNPYRTLVEVSRAEQHAHMNAIDFANRLEKQTAKTANIFAAMHEERWVRRAQTKAFSAWRLYCLQLKVERLKAALSGSSNELLTDDQPITRPAPSAEATPLSSHAPHSLFQMRHSHSAHSSRPSSVHQTPVKKALHAKLPMSSAFPATTDPSLFANSSHLA